MLDEQPAARRMPRAAIERRFMCCDTPFGSEELACEVEADLQRVRLPARRRLRERRALFVKFNWKTCAPARFSIAKPYSAVFGARPARRGDTSAER